MTLIETFIKSTSEFVLVGFFRRYGGGFVTFICPVSMVEMLTESVEETNGENEFFGLTDDPYSWLPVGFGDNKKQAEKNLEKKLKNLLPYAREIDYAFSKLRVSVNNGNAYSYKHEIVTIPQIIESYNS